MTLFYIDTNIWLDFHFNRTDKNRNLGLIASKFFYYILRNESKIAISSKLFEELNGKLSINEINGLIVPFIKRLVNLKESRELHNLSEQISKERNIPKTDVLYALLAKENNAIVITRDNHFKQLSDICISKRPEELL